MKNRTKYRKISEKSTPKYVFSKKNGYLCSPFRNLTEKDKGEIPDEY